MSTVSVNNLARSIYAATKDKSNEELDATLSNVVHFLEKKKMLSKSKLILNKLKEIVDKENKTIEAKVYSAQVLDPDSVKEIVKELKEKYQANNVNIENIIESDLVAGVKIEVGEEVIDLTLKKKIAQLKKHLLN